MILIVVAGIVAGLAIFLQITMFVIAGEHLTQRLRKQAFAAMLRQEIGWYDCPGMHMQIDSELKMKYGEF